VGPRLLIGALFFPVFFFFIFDKNGPVAPYGSITQTSLNHFRVLVSKPCLWIPRTITTSVGMKFSSTANPHAPVPMAKTTELDVLSPIADHATAGYAAILDRGNLSDAEVFKELVRKSVVPALHYANTEVF